MRTGNYRKPVRLIGRKREGQVLVIVILAFCMLVGLVIYVYNLGHQVNRRLALQNAADSSVISGGTWMARSMNVVAMNNVAESRMLAMVLLLDSVPLAVEMAHEEMIDWEQCLSDQIRRGIPATKNDYLRSGIVSLHSRMETELDILAKADELINHSGFDMAEVTNWHVSGVEGEDPNGELWRAIVALNDLSEATCASAGVLAQANAVRFGRDNGADDCLMAPILPKIPAKVGVFEDFQPVLEGKLHVESNQASCEATGGNGGAIPDFAFPHRLGPWARLYQWRDYTYYSSGGRWVPGAAVRGVSPNVSIGGQSSGSSAISPNTGYTVDATVTLTGYNTYGPRSWAVRQLQRMNILDSGDLPDSFFPAYMNQLSDIKLDYMFTSKTEQRIHYPDWITDYSEARAFAMRHPERVYRTMFYRVQIISTAPEDSANWLSQGTYYTNGDKPIATWVSGWVDPQAWPIPQKGDYIWKDNYSYQATADDRIGLAFQYDANGNPVWHDVYVVEWYIWGGIDVGEDVPVTDPCNWGGGADLPAPILLDTSEGDYTPDSDEGIRRSRFSFFAAARKSAASPVWPQRFGDANPSGKMVAVAQAKLFNKYSWDLWTQGWQVRLTPVTKWNDWRKLIIDGSAELDGNMLLEAYTVREIYEYLSNIDSAFAENCLQH